MLNQAQYYEINFATFKTSVWSNKARETRVSNSSDCAPASFKDQYGLEMLNSLGFVFQDKWVELTDRILRWSERDEQFRYKLCCYVFKTLCIDHGYDLRQAIVDFSNENLVVKVNPVGVPCTASIEPKERLQVASCKLTPLQLILQPMVTTSGSRALRNLK
jgi:hypothetical protein